MSNLDLSIIILSYNTKDITDECLSRLQVAVDRCQKELKNMIEVIVLDNASSDESVEMIKKNHPWVKLIESKMNTGYSKGNNLAFKKTKYPIILFLNSDVYVEEETLGRALEYFKTSYCDVLGPKLVLVDGNFQPSAGNLPDPFNIPAWILGLSLVPGLNQLTHSFHPNFRSYFSEASKVGWVTGAFFMIKREVFEAVGRFDEAIFMYLDEVDLCKRIKDKGFKIWYVPTIEVTHLHGASSKFDPSLALVGELKGLRHYFKKYYSGWYIVVKLFLILGLILRIIAFSLLGKTKSARAYVEGLSVI